MMFKNPLECGHTSLQMQQPSCDQEVELNDVNILVPWRHLSVSGSDLPALLRMSRNVKKRKSQPLFAYVIVVKFSVIYS